MYYLGVDGGGTKTKFILADEQGKILADDYQPTCHYLQVGLDGVTEIINKGIEEVCAKANVSRKDIVSAFVGCPGYGDIKKDMPIIAEAVKKGMNGINCSIGNDGENAMAGALCGKDGINIVCGTGSIGFGHNSINNTTLSCGGWHHAIGSDEGSGYWMSYHLLHEFTRQADGRDEKTQLYDAVKQHLELEEDGDVIEVVVNKWNVDRTKVASLSRVVADLYDKGDKYAKKIVDDAAKELSEIINTLYNRLQFNDCVNVSYTGGIFNFNEKIINPLKSYLLPGRMNLVAPEFEPDCGSLLLAYKNNNIEITDTIIANIKSTFIK